MSLLVIVALLLGVLAPLAPVQADVVQVQVLARHGLRNVFHRNEIEVWDDGGQLSGHGYAQMAAMGAAFRQRYSNRTGPAPAAWNETELAKAVMARSTDSLTSMMSATAFMLGLVPPGSGPVDELTGKAALPGALDPVGVHTVPMPLDIPLRAYDKCPKFIDGLDVMMNSTEITNWQTQNQAALDKLAKITRSNVTAVTYLDAFEIIAVDHAFRNSTNITDTEFDQYEQMASFLAGKMFTGAETSRMLSGRLLANMAQQIAAAVDVRNMTIPFIYLSGQYPTIMATYSALGVYGAAKGGIAAELPSPGAALVVELHQDNATQSFSVRVLVHDASRNRIFQEVVLDACDGAAMCPLDRFMSLLTASALAQPSEWCALCNNTMTPPCNIGNTVEIPVPAPCPPPSDAASGTVPAQTVNMDGDRSAAYGIVTGVGLGFLLATVLYAIIRCTKSRVLQDRLLPHIQQVWNRRCTRTPHHVELQA